MRVGGVLGLLSVGLSHPTLRDLEDQYPYRPYWNAVFVLGMLVVWTSFVTAVVACVAALKTRRWDILATVAATFLITIFVIPTFFHACCAAGDSSPVANLRTIATAEVTYAGSGPKTQPYGSIADLIATGFLDARFKDDSIVNGYRFTVIVAADGRTYTALATPASPDSKSVYYSDQERNVRRGSKNGQFVARDYSSVREVSNDDRAITRLIDINSAERMYAGGYGNLEDLMNDGLLDSRFRNIVSGFNFNITLSNDRRSYRATAEPASPYSGKYAYFVTPDFVVRYTTNPALAPAGATGTPVQ